MRLRSIQNSLFTADSLLIPLAPSSGSLSFQSLPQETVFLEGGVKLRNADNHPYFSGKYNCRSTRTNRSLEGLRTGRESLLDPSPAIHFH